MDTLAPGLAFPMKSPKSALGASQYELFERVSYFTYDDVPIFAWEPVLNDESKLWSGEAAAATNERTPVEQEGCQIENRWANKEDVIAREAIPAAKEFVTTGLMTMIEAVLDVVLSKTFYNAQIGMRSDFSTMLSMLSWTCHPRTSLQRR